MIRKRGTRSIAKVDHIGPMSFVWHLDCGHTMNVKQRPRDGQRTAVCEACRGGSAHPERSTGAWRTKEAKHG
jgi:hypothetical protein